MNDVSRNQGVQVISRAADILRVLAEDTDGLSLGMIAKRVELPRSTVQRLVNALQEEGFVSTGRGGRGITLGPEIQALAQAGRVDPSEALRPVMKSISEETGETVDLAVLDGARMLFLDQVVGSQRLRTVSNIGERFPLSTTANGKSSLSLLDESDATRLILSEIDEGIQNRSVSDVLAELSNIHEVGISVDQDEHTDGISALGFALRDGAGRIFALSIPVPSTRFARRKDELRRILQNWKNQLDNMGL